MRTLTEVTRVDDVLLDLAATDVRGLFDAIAEHLARERVLPESVAPAQVSAALLRREQAASTVIGHGVAIPHAHVKGLARARVLYVRPRAALWMASPDAAPVLDMLILLVPAPVSDEHLTLLARAASCFSTPDFRTALRACHDTNGIRALFAEHF